MMVTKAPIDKAKAKNLMAEIEENAAALQIFANMSPAEFSNDKKNYAIGEHHLRRALEGILTVGTHLLSRLPAKTKDYQEVILALGRHGVVPSDFAAANRQLAGYRNRLVHIYWEVSVEELHQVIKRHLPDLEKFVVYFADYIKRH